MREDEGERWLNVEEKRKKWQYRKMTKKKGKENVEKAIKKNVEDGEKMDWNDG